MIKVLVTNFFEEIEKRELKKNKNAKATFWVKELQEVDYNNKNYVGVKKATRLYNKYVEGRKNVIVKEPNKYLLDFMSHYLKHENYEEYKSLKKMTDKDRKSYIPEVFKRSKKKISIKKIGISLSILLILPLLFFFNKYQNNDVTNCILWNKNHFEKSSCKTKKSIDNSVYTIDIDKFKKLEITKETVFFKKGRPIVWYGKSSTGILEFFTYRGVHPKTLKELKPITTYIINKYVLNNKTFLN